MHNKDYLRPQNHMTSNETGPKLAKNSFSPKPRQRHACVYDLISCFPSRKCYEVRITVLDNSLPLGLSLTKRHAA